MAAIRTLSKPPIVEGLLDIQFAANDHVTPEIIERLADTFAEKYPYKRKLETAVAALNFGEASFSADAGPIAFDCIVREDGESEMPRHILQFRRSRLTASLVGNYTTWDDLLSTMRPAFEAFVAECRPSVITRIATRFINRVELPRISIDLDEYFTGGPRIPEGVPQVVFNFMHRAGVVDEDNHLRAWLTHQMGDTAGISHSNVLLDIDVFSLERFPPVFDALEETWAAMRDLKNRLFFGSLTEKALESYV